MTREEKWTILVAACKASWTTRSSILLNSCSGQLRLAPPARVSGCTLTSSHSSPCQNSITFPLIFSLSSLATYERGNLLSTCDFTSYCPSNRRPAISSSVQCFLARSMFSGLSGFSYSDLGPSGLGRPDYRSDCKLAAFGVRLRTTLRWFKGVEQSVYCLNFESLPIKSSAASFYYSSSLSLAMTRHQNLASKHQSQPSLKAGPSYQHPIQHDPIWPKQVFHYSETGCTTSHQRLASDRSFTRIDESSTRMVL